LVMASTFKKPSLPHRPNKQGTVERHLRRKPQLKEVQKLQKEDTTVPGGVNDIDLSLEESDNSEHSNSSLLSSDLSSSDISGSHDDAISSQQLVVSLEQPRLQIREKLAHTYRQPLEPGPFKTLDEPTKEDTEGIIKLSHLPYGFFENQLKKFFSQFGDIKRVNLVRSRKTGNSQGRAYVQFKDPIVAQIVADTMDGYIMFSHVLKCVVVPEEHYEVKFWQKVKRPRELPHKRHARKLLYPKTAEQEASRRQRLSNKDRKRRNLIELSGITYEPPKRKFIRAQEEIDHSTETENTTEEDAE